MGGENKGTVGFRYMRNLKICNAIDEKFRNI